MARRSGRLLLGLLIGGLLIGGLGFLTAGFTSFDPTEWANRFKPVIPEPDDDDDDDTTTDPDDTTDPDEEEQPLDPQPEIYRIVWTANVNLTINDLEAEYYEIIDGDQEDIKIIDIIKSDYYHDGFTARLSIVSQFTLPVYLIQDSSYDKLVFYAFTFNDDLDVDFDISLDYGVNVLALGLCEDYYVPEFKLISHRPFKASDFETPEEPAPQARHIGVQMAFGIDGRQELNVVLTPANADVNLSFSVDKTEVIVNKTGYKSADVYVTNYFAGYATITVTDSISGKTGTGKVYSYGKTILVSSWDLVQGYHGGFIVSNSSDPRESGGPHNVVAAGTVDYGLSYYNSTGEFLPLVHDTDDYFYSGDWIHLIDTVYFHVAYNGSFAPKIKNTSDNNAIYSKSNDVAKAPGVAQTIIEVELVEGYNDILIIGGETGGSVLAALTLVYAQEVSNMSVPDLTFIS